MRRLVTMVRNQRARAREEPGNIPLQIETDHLEQILPEMTPLRYESGRRGGLWSWVFAILLVGTLFCAGLYAHRAEAGGGTYPPQVQIAVVQPASEPDPFSWVEAIAAVGVMLAGVGSCGWVVRKRRGLGG